MYFLNLGVKWFSSTGSSGTVSTVGTFSAQTTSDSMHINWKHFLDQGPVTITPGRSSEYLAIFPKRQSARVHVQHARDVVALGEAGQRQRMLAIVVQVAAVRTVQPHVCRRAVVLVRDGVLGHAYTRSLVAPVFLVDEELPEEK